MSRLVLVVSVVVVAQEDNCSSQMSKEGGQNVDLSAPFKLLKDQAAWSRLPASDDALESLSRDGVALLKNVLDKSQVMKVREMFDDVFEACESAMTEMETEDGRGSFYVSERNVEGLRVRRTGRRGRFDFKSFDRRDGGDLVHRLNLTEAYEPFLAHEAITRVLEGGAMKTSSGWRLKAAGALTALGEAEVGDWHRDTGEGLFGDEAVDLYLPDYYFSALFPLDETSAEQGTEFVLGSHKIPSSQLDNQPRKIAAGNPGDLLIFNGKMVHRGRPNAKKTSRTLGYLVYTAKWYEQGRDPRFEHWTGGG